MWGRLCSVIFRRRAFPAGLLLAIAAAPASAADPGEIAFFNHAYAIVDPETAAAISESAYLRQIASLEVRRTVAGDRSWSGRYLQGRETYFEFFGPPDLEPGQLTPVGTLGIAFSVERVKQLASVEARLRALGLKTETSTIPRTLGERQIPWFDVLSLVEPSQDPDPRMPKSPFVAAWLMEYSPAYFDEPATAKEPADGPEDIVTRERYNSDDYAKKLVRDVVGIEIAITRKDYREKLDPILRASGARIETSGRRVTARGALTTLRIGLTDDASKTGLRGITMSLNRAVQRDATMIGRSRFVIGPGRTARWTFLGPEERRSAGN